MPEVKEFKRRITPEQLEELSAEQKKRLREWWKPAEGDYFCCERWLVGRDAAKDAIIVNSRMGVMPNGETYYHPLLDIGQMIHFLITHGVAIRSFPCDKEAPGALVDYLWGLVKDALNDSEG